MATSPGLLLLDEPLSALDAKVRVHLRHEVKDLQRRLGVTTIMVTHDQEEALTMADRIVVMDHGVIEQVGTPEEIYGAPATSFVADFIGTMNFVSGVVEADGSVKVGNMTLACQTDGMAPGQAVSVAIRPEDIDAEGISEGGDNMVEVEIEAMEFLGSFYRVALGGVALGEQGIRADLSINLVRRKKIEIGSKLPVCFPGQFIRIYPGA
jgi:iron(III) transport system ATP-binding protein